MEKEKDNNPRILVSQRTKGQPVKVDSHLEFYAHTDAPEMGDEIQLEGIWIDISIKATPENWLKLDEALTGDSERVIENLRHMTEAAVKEVKKYGTPKGRPLTERRLIANIKREAAYLYAYLQCFNGEQEKPLPVQELIAFLKLKEYSIAKYNALEITRATMELLYKRKAKDELLKPFKTMGNFYKTYILPQKIRYVKEYLRNSPDKISPLKNVFNALNISLKGTANLQ